MPRPGRCPGPLAVNEGFRADAAGSILGDPGRRRKAAEQPARFVERQRVAGINLDFEGPFARSRHHYTEFVHDLAGRLHAMGTEVSVDVVCQTGPPHSIETFEEQSDPTSAPWVASWAEPYDYPALGEAVDRLILMGYDFHARGSEPGPVGPVWWLRRVLECTLRVVAASKVVLGLPFYGRPWVSVRPMAETEWWPPQPATYEMPRSATDSGFEPGAGLSRAQAAEEMAFATRTGRHALERSPWGSYRQEDGRLVVVHYFAFVLLLILNESFAATNEREGSEIARQIVRAFIEK